MPQPTHIFSLIFLTSMVLVTRALCAPPEENYHELRIVEDKKCQQIFYRESGHKELKIDLVGEQKPEYSVQAVDAKWTTQSGELRSSIPVRFPKNRDRVDYRHLELKTSNEQDIVINGLMMREAGWTRRQLPKLYVSIPGGPGLSGLTMKSFEVMGNDHLFIIPPGNSLWMESSHTDLTEVRQPYRAWIESMAKLIEAELRDPAQEVVLLAHSYGGFYAADLMEYGLEKSSIKIIGAVLIAAPITKSTYNAIEENRRNANLEGWDETFEEYQKAFGNNEIAKLRDLYRKLVLLYGPLLHNDNPRTKAIVEDLIAKDPVSPQAMLLNTRRMRDGEEVVTKIQRLIKTYPIDIVGILGENDRLMDSRAAREDYSRAGFLSKVIEDGSHFPFVDDLPTIINYLRTIKSEITPRTHPSDVQTK